MTLEEYAADSNSFTVNLKNPTKDIAFFNRLKLLGSDEGLVRPVSFSDNYFTLIPNEKKSIRVKLLAPEKLEEPIVLELEGWNGTASRIEFE